ncbi:MAG TPA: hypothetical protein VIN77_06785 [Aurantimonas sp.]|uniref:Hemerythrin-like domain-containing protein n=1 Tax=Aurantimonas marianensis TaxID=2920428 RepID=A0A9X2H9I8_9HYPH|nr:hypothetical protein [Aurantimonas marianensis]MCP3056323.1 hypothetical protein [Aurantimonas marianensis]
MKTDPGKGTLLSKATIMRAPLIVSAAASMLAVAASAAPSEAPYVLSAPHADFLMQLEDAAAAPSQIGAAARAAADLFGQHAEAEEAVILPLLALTEAVAGGKAVADLPRVLTSREGLDAELPLLLDAQIEVVGALVELFAVAKAEVRPEVSRLAEQIIWHEMTDIEVLYPAAVLVNSSVEARLVEAESAKIPIGPAPLYGRDPIPMMGLGNPHALSAAQ